MVDRDAARVLRRGDKWPGKVRPGKRATEARQAGHGATQQPTTGGDLHQPKRGFNHKPTNQPIQNTRRYGSIAGWDQVVVSMVVVMIEQ